MAAQPFSIYAGNDFRAASEGAAGASLSRAAAIGAPIGMAGLTLAGLDPFSMALRSGLASYGAGAGLGGAMLTGATVGVPMGLSLGALAYMGNQMMTGASQVQSFNQDMRSSFPFFNTSAFGGRGFASGDIREIGNVVRSIASTGEMGFDELGRLAVSMGRMGLAQGIRNAKEFNEKFRDMLKSVKTIAQELSTTLEEAQTMMASMRGSGIFSNQANVVRGIRQASIAGGLATTEVTGMLQIGSQISRMFGGTGRQGAMGGMEAITQVGVANQLGILSEEDIFNATGLTGAEGRRALAMQGLQATGQFLRSVKGRRFLASVAGRDGQLDMESVANWMAGGMTVEQTRSQGDRNLARVGRANFIRNEGRLRGAVMEQFGGLAPALAMLQWAGGRGIDINDMDDRAMLFAQRQLGMGRDEADAAIAMARRLPELLQARRAAREDDMLLRDRAERFKRSGSPATRLQRRFDIARNAINNEMQRVGQDIMNVTTDTVERFAAELAGVYEERVIEGIREAHRAARLGGTGGARIMRGLIGARETDPGLRALTDSSSAISGMGPRENFSQREFLERIQELRFSAGMGELSQLSPAGRAFASRNRSALRRAYAQGGIAGLGGEDRILAIQRLLRQHSDSGGAEVSLEFKSMNASQRAAFVQQLEREIGIAEEARLAETFRDPKFGSDGLLGVFDDSPVAQLVGGSGPRTAAEFHALRGTSILGIQRSGLAKAIDILQDPLHRRLEKRAAAGLIKGFREAAGLIKGFREGGDVLGSLKGAWSGLISGIQSVQEEVDTYVPKRSFVGNLFDEVTGTAKRARAASMFLDSAQGREMMFGLLSGDAGALEAAQDEASRIMAQQARGEKLSEEELGRLGIIQRGMIALDLKRAVRARGGVQNMTDRDWDALVAQTKQIVEREGGDASAVTRETVKSIYGEISGAATKQQQEVIAKLASQARKSSIETRRELRAGGIAQLTSEGNLVLSDTARERLMKEGGAAAVQASELALAAENLSGQLRGTEETADADRDVLNRIQSLHGEVFDSLSEMSVKELRAFARVHAGTSLGGLASEQLMFGQRLRSKLKKRGATAAGAIASELGISLSEDELAGLKGLSASEVAARLGGRLGVSGDSNFLEQLTKAVEAAGTQGGAQKAASVLSRAILQADKSTREKLEEAQGRGPDPLTKIIDKISEGNRHLEVLVKSNKDAQQYLRDISSNTRSPDGEKEVAT